MNRNYLSPKEKYVLAEIAAVLRSNGMDAYASRRICNAIVEEVNSLEDKYKKVDD